MGNEEPCLVKASEQAAQAGSRVDCRAELGRGIASRNKEAEPTCQVVGRTQQPLRAGGQREQTWCSVIEPSSLEEAGAPHLGSQQILTTPWVVEPALREVKPLA